MANKKLESISALLDDEVIVQELNDTLSELENEQKDTFSRYSLIGDVLRNEHHIEPNSRFAESIQAALENVQQESVATNTTNLLALNSHPKWHQRMAQRVKQLTESNSVRNVSQLAIAASVAFVAVVGVSNMQPANENIPSPVLQTTPILNGISPVSTDGLAQKPSADQVTQSRINSLIADHNQQLRTQGEDETEKEKKEPIER